MLYSYVGSSPLQVTLDRLNALHLRGFKSPPSHAGLVECFTAMWVQVLSKSHWIGWMLYIYVGSSPLQVMLDWLKSLQIRGLKSWWIGWLPYSYMGSCPFQVTLDWLNALQLCGFKSCWIGWHALQVCGLKSTRSHGGLVEWFTATWFQVPSKSRWIGWMLYSYVGSSSLQVMLDWLNALQLCGFKSPPSYAGLVECFTAMWVQVPSKSCWIGWNLYRYMG